MRIASAFHCAAYRPKIPYLIRPQKTIQLPPPRTWSSIVQLNTGTPLSSATSVREPDIDIHGEMPHLRRGVHNVFLGNLSAYSARQYNSLTSTSTHEECIASLLVRMTGRCIVLANSVRNEPVGRDVWRILD